MMLARKSLLLFAVNIGKSVLGFLSTMAIARWMGPEALGTTGYMLGLLGMLAVLLDMGLAFAHLKRVSESNEDPAPLVGAFLVLKTLLVPVFVIAVTLLPLARERVGQPLFQSADERYVYYIFAAFYIVNSLSSVLLFTFEARLESAKQGVANLASGLLAFLAKAAVAVLGLGIVALSAAYLVEPVALLVSAVMLFGGYRIARPQRAHLASYIRYSLPLTLNTAISMAVANVNPVLLGAYWADTEVGYYTSVLGFGILLERLTSTVSVLFLPQASSDAAQGNLADIRRRLFVAERHVLTVMVPLGATMVFFSHQAVQIAFGSEFAPAAPILMVVVINSVLGAIFAPYSMVLYATEKQRYLVISNALRLLILLIANMLLVPSYAWGFSLPGLKGIGSAIALVIMTIAGGIAQARAVGRSTRIGFYWKSLLYLLAGGVMYLAMHIAGRLITNFQWPRIMLSTAFGVGAYLATLIWLGLFTRADFQVFVNMLSPQRMLDYISSELGHR
jgi:O-antigen/teichoic acid export membrane protein